MLQHPSANAPGLAHLRLHQCLTRARNLSYLSTSCTNGHSMINAARATIISHDDFRDQHDYMREVGRILDEHQSLDLRTIATCERQGRMWLCTSRQLWLIQRRIVLWRCL